MLIRAKRGSCVCASGAVDGPATMPSIDYVPWPLGQEDDSFGRMVTCVTWISGVLGSKPTQALCAEPYWFHPAWCSLLNVNVPPKQKVTACAQGPGVGDPPRPQRSLLSAGPAAGIMFGERSSSGSGESEPCGRQVEQKASVQRFIIMAADTVSTGPLPQTTSHCYITASSHLEVRQLGCNYWTKD